MPQILIVEDEVAIADTLLFALNGNGFAARHVSLAGEALALLRCDQIDLVILDVGLPDMTGFEVCKQLRQFSAVPVMFLTARAEEIDRVVGLEIGADDYVVKPFSLKELAARAKVALRRASGTAEAPQGYRDESWEIEFDAYVVRYKGEEIRLTHKEFELFRYMVERPGRVLTRERLLERVWGWESEIDARSIDAHIRRLRLKLGPARNHVETVVGLGYRFVK